MHPPLSDRDLGYDKEERLPGIGRSAALGALALVVVGALGIGYSVVALNRDGNGRSATAAASASPSAVQRSGAGTLPQTAAPTPSVAPAAPDVPGLAAPVFAPPPTWQAVPDAEARTGKVDLKRAVEIDGHGRLSRIGLTQLGFVVGNSRSWVGGDAALLVLDYTFREPRGASGFVSYARSARDADPAFQRQPRGVLPGAVSYRGSRGGNATSVIIFSRGRSAYILGIQGSPPTGPPGDIQQLALLQYQAAAG